MNPERNIDDLTPVPLALAVDLFFPAGGVKISTLRTEAKRGNLVMTRIGGKDFVTRNAIQDMIKRCQDQHCRPASFSAKTATGKNGGSSGIGNTINAQDALRAKLTEQIKSCPNTSQHVTRPTPAKVVRLKS